MANHFPEYNFQADGFGERTSTWDRFGRFKSASISRNRQITPEDELTFASRILLGRASRGNFAVNRTKLSLQRSVTLWVPMRDEVRLNCSA